jgi:hypothetical protein
MVLWERAHLWRAEADAASLDAMRQLCLTEAARCEHRVALSFSTPLFRDSA